MKCNAVDMGIKIRDMSLPEKRSIFTFLCIKYPDLIQIMRRSKYIYALEHCDTMIV